MLQYMKKPMTNTGWWIPDGLTPAFGDHEVKRAIEMVTRPVTLIDADGRFGVGNGGSVRIGPDISPESANGSKSYPVLAYAPALHPQNLGDPIFKAAHGLTYPYVMGAMANGITSVEMVLEAARSGMIGFFGAAGLHPNDIASAIDRLNAHGKNLPAGCNLIYSPNDPQLEAETVRLYLKNGISLVSASAYMEITLPLVLFRVKGIRQEPDGAIFCPNRIIAKVSRVEVAKKFFAPPPEKLLTHLVDREMISREEADLAKHIPMAEDLTAEADSGGHTDNRPAISLLPTMLALRNSMQDHYRYQRQLCVGLAGGIATPDSAAAAFAMGAGYVLTGSVNQACVEAGTCDTVRQMLAEAGQADVTMAPAADMFEMGVKVQVLKRGTMFPLRAAKLYDLYNTFDSLESIPDVQKKVLERDFFQCSLDQEWDQTKAFFTNRDPKQIDRAEKDPKHKMALVFRSYLGKSSNWANSGDPSRKIDYQIWCGPAIGAFNEWTKGSFLAAPENRSVVTVAMNLLYGASVATRLNWIRSQGAVVPLSAGMVTPRTLTEINDVLEG
jgi:trans-AT polyketide synthase, acyltransferase and oxidoreductase domains